MDKLVETLDITSLSKSQVSVMAKQLDATTVEAFRTRPLDAGPYTFMAADALVLKVREGGRVGNVHALIAVGVNAEGYREILGVDVTTAEDGAGWLTFLRSLTAPGSLRCPTGHQRCACRVGGRDWCHLAGGGLAALQNALHDQPDVRDTEGVVAVGAHFVAFGVRST